MAYGADGMWRCQVCRLAYYRARHAGKKAAGRLLDGVEHNGFPEVAP